MTDKEMISVSRDELHDLLTEVAKAIMFFKTQDKLPANMLRAAILEEVADPLRKVSGFREIED